MHSSYDCEYYCEQYWHNIIQKNNKNNIRLLENLSLIIFNLININKKK